jgi:restriction system protein
LWVVRAGKEGEQERAALENNVVTIGWNEFPDLSAFKDKRDLEQLYAKLQPNAKKMKIAVMVGQIWNFTTMIKKGDIVILPLKAQPGLAVAEVIGDYEYRENSDYMKHIRKVRWLTTISRSEIDPDLARSFGAALTVFKIDRNDAESRVIEYIKKKMKPTDTGREQETKEPSIESPNRYNNSAINKNSEYNLLKPVGAIKSATLFKEINYTVSKLIDDIKIGEIGLPDIQRPFVCPT